MADANIKKKVPRRIAQAIIGSLKGGVVPRVGLPFVTVGRKHEIEALLRDIDIIADGGASFRFIAGRYGSGKSFLMQTIRNYAMERGFVVCDADLSPERRLMGTRGQGLATYRELVQNLATRTRPEGGALTLAIDKWISGVEAAVAGNGVSVTDARFQDEVERRIFTVIRSMDELVHGFDFARILTIYCRSYWAGDDEKKSLVMKWLRGEYQTKTEAKKELGVNAIVTDDDWYEYLKLFAYFFCQAGYRGMLVFIDELVNIYRIPNTITRNNNYEKILTMYNDAMQGRARHIGMIMSGTPECLEDRRRGVYSYEALRSRLAEGKFAGENMRDMLAPVIHLDPLTPEEMMVLTEKLRDIHAGLYGYETRVTEDDLSSFVKIEYARVGADRHITPREIIRDFIELLDIVYQHPEKTATDILSSDAFKVSEEKDDGGDFADFVL
ncbi:MAG: ATP-binding protein [Selenomonadaceae bacterium]